MSVCACLDLSTLRECFCATGGTVAMATGTLSLDLRPNVNLTVD